MWLSNLVNTVGRLLVSLVMWGGAIAISITALNEHSGLMALFLVAIPWVFAVGGTAIIWSSEATGHNHAPDVTQSSEKAKRRSRREEQMALLTDLMDDDERDDFKERLKRRILEDTNYADGELPETGGTLESLLGEEQAKRLRR